jgi:hypothetical protein
MFLTAFARFHRELERAYVEPDGSRITWAEVTGPATGCYLVPVKPIRDILPCFDCSLE